MNKETKGKVIGVSKQWWFKVNTKALRCGTFDGAAFPHIIKVSYTVDGVEYTKRKWVGAGISVPMVGESVKVICCEDKPKNVKIVL